MNLIRNRRQLRALTDLVLSTFRHFFNYTFLSLGSTITYHKYDLNQILMKGVFYFLSVVLTITVFQTDQWTRGMTAFTKKRRGGWTKDEHGLKIQGVGMGCFSRKL